MASTKIRLASRAYDGVLPILRGQLKIPGVEFEFTETDDVPGMFAGMFKGQFDVSEMSLAELIYYTSRGKADFVAIPVFPSRMFRHGFIFCRKDARIRSPADLSGRRIGFLRWVQTAAIWMRGMLVDEYGVSAKNSEWYVAAIHHWDDADPGATVEPRDGSVIRMIQNSGTDSSKRACRALFDGQVDALGITESQLATLLADQSVKRLFANPREVEASYYRKTKILPIMHVLALQRRLADKHPELPAKLFRLFVDSKRWGQRWRRAIPSLVEAWPNHYLDEEQKVFDSDPWAYGLEANRHVLDRFLGYCHAQGISAKTIAPEELFHPTTLSLAE
ncbi:MAG: ABC transporter substrate-binding protein [Deltaproteobacteria bacterium]|nr:ABC transporter substrate-binding protein [Deltaproteobacteria bacterium]MBI2230722.1 ABC transporter substrate-binding protein [Deltaproteobacteria bacterium]MBI2364477.1 ABC transporter substrate-binding protein [Deltaproteobacteria bacterium]